MTPNLRPFNLVSCEDTYKTSLSLLYYTTCQCILGEVGGFMCDRRCCLVVAHPRVLFIWPVNSGQWTNQLGDLSPLPPQFHHQTSPNHCSTSHESLLSQPKPGMYSVRSCHMRLRFVTFCHYETPSPSINVRDSIVGQFCPSFIITHNKIHNYELRLAYPVIRHNK